MANPQKGADDKLTDDEVAQRRDAILRRMHKLPPKLQKEMVGKGGKHMSKSTGKKPRAK